MEWWQLAVLALAGVAAGFINVMAGGGSLITVPIMLFMGVPGPVANGTIRIAILAQNATAIFAFFRQGFADFKLSLSLAACAIPGAVLGALLGTSLEGVWFERVVALIMLGVLLIMAISPNAGTPEVTPTAPPSPQRMIWGHVLMVGVGFYGGFIQLGVGFLIMPVLHRVMGFDLIRTNMHKVFVICCYTAVALMVFASRVEILWIAGAAMAFGNSLGGWIAAVTQIRKGENLVKWVLYGVLIIFVIKLLFF
jgi:uncharacterized membrane protein YfcA